MTFIQRNYDNDMIMNWEFLSYIDFIHISTKHNERYVGWVKLLLQCEEL